MVGTPRIRARRAEKALEELRMAHEATLKKLASVGPENGLIRDGKLTWFAKLACPNCETPVEIELSIDLNKLTMTVDQEHQV